MVITYVTDQRCNSRFKKYKPNNLCQSLVWSSALQFLDSTALAQLSVLHPRADATPGLQAGEVDSVFLAAKRENRDLGHQHL